MYLAYNNISLKELAEKTGITYNTILNIRKTNKFTKRNLDKICTCLNIEIKDVMRYDEN